MRDKGQAKAFLYAIAMLSYATALEALAAFGGGEGDSNRPYMALRVLAALGNSIAVPFFFSRYRNAAARSLGSAWFAAFCAFSAYAELALRVGRDFDGFAYVVLCFSVFAPLLLGVVLVKDAGAAFRLRPDTSAKAVLLSALSFVPFAELGRIVLALSLGGASGGFGGLFLSLGMNLALLGLLAVVYLGKVPRGRTMLLLSVLALRCLALRLEPGAGGTALAVSVSWVPPFSDLRFFPAYAFYYGGIACSLLVLSFGGFPAWLRGRFRGRGQP